MKMLTVYGSGYGLPGGVTYEVATPTGRQPITREAIEAHLASGGTVRWNPEGKQ